MSMCQYHTARLPCPANAVIASRYAAAVASTTARRFLRE